MTRAAAPEISPDERDAEEQKTVAMQFLLDAWEDALSSGCAPELIATSAINAALSDLVDLFGEEHVADMASGLSDRIRRGEFSMRAGELH
jgi:hypothetical protein